MELLSEIDGVSCHRPTGSFYTFPDFSAYYGKSYQGETITGSVDFARFLLKEAQIALVPGVAFGADNNVRLSFATSQEIIKKGMGRIAEAVAKLR